ncbi:hypothetical protein PRK78_002325 [Emydomyces testavorans]|uniref:F-box domain-containing protein n=1 Tax=Emydomyces testavorans TaxID=2070801 RepID=A0AAF0DFH3_9EURO|nr:hypothetical protein PRK78_002325 [Emydomyces testavorans]
MERTIYTYVRLVAMYVVNIVGLPPMSCFRCPLRRLGTLYSLLSTWYHGIPKPATPPMGLISLPPEIILCVGEHLSEKDLNSLIRTAKTFAELLTPQLYDFVVGCRVSPKSQNGSGSSKPKFFTQALFHAGCWQSDYVLNYFRTKRVDALLRKDATGCLLLNKVARAGNAKLIRILLDRGADVNGQSKREPHSLLWAASNGHEEAVRILLDAGANVDTFKPCQKSILHSIYRSKVPDNPAISQLLIDRLKIRGELSRKNRKGATPLHCAVESNKTYAVPQLIQAGADLTILDDDGQSVLDVALRLGRMDVVRLLIAAFPGPWPSHYMKSTLWRSCDRLDLAMLKRISPLLASRTVLVDISWGDETLLGLTLLHIAARGPRDWSQASASAFSRKNYLNAICRWEAIIDLLLEMGADIFAQDRMGRTALLFAIEHGDPERIPFLLQRLGETISIPDRLGRTPLHAAVHNDKSELAVRYLLLAGIDINARDFLGQTALHYAATTSQALPALECLLNAGADTSLTDHHGFPPMHFAATQRRDRSLKLLVDARASFHKDCETCHQKTMQWRTEDGEWEQELPDLNDLFRIEAPRLASS